MKTLKRFEELIEGMIEGSLAEVTAGHLHPIEIAKKLGRILDSEQTIAAGKTLVPNIFTVQISSDDYAVFYPFRKTLERELASYLAALAQERGLSFVARPQVTIVENMKLRPRRLQVVASLSDAVSSSAAVEAEQISLTAPLPVSQVRAALARPARLTLTDGRTVTLDKPVISLGRGLDNDIVLEDKRVSRHHAQIRLRNGWFCLYDLASVNGSTVNGQIVNEVVLRDGDRIALGGVELTFTVDAQGARRGA